MDSKEPKNMKYPIGQRDFKLLREQGQLYVDKTGFIEKLVDEDQYYFLTRPRGFGKSLLISTLKYFFLGQRQLFKGLYIDSSNWGWEEYPVLHFDLNTGCQAKIGHLEKWLDILFQEWEEKYEIHSPETDYPERFHQIIKAAYHKTGQHVVILVDEGDLFLVNNINDSEQFKEFSKKLAAIYSNFKSSAEYIELVFMTGVSRFSKLSVFSDLNNLRDITFSEQYADICGITEEELHRYFTTGIRMLADKEGWSYEMACAELKLNYGGYHFSRSGSDIFNPWSLLNALQESVISDYWVDARIPGIIAESLCNRNVDWEKLLDTYCTLDQLKRLDLNNIDPLPLLYQTGYLTIKDYDRETQLFHLGIPNCEITHHLL